MCTSAYVQVCMLECVCVRVCVCVCSVRACVLLIEHTCVPAACECLCSCVWMCVYCVPLCVYTYAFEQLFICTSVCVGTCVHVYARVCLKQAYINTCARMSMHMHVWYLCLLINIYYFVHHAGLSPRKAQALKCAVRGEAFWTGQISCTWQSLSRRACPTAT